MKANPEALARLLEDSGVDFKTTKRSYVFTCPRCSKPGKLMMFRDDGRFICWVCAETTAFKGSADLALSEILGRTRGEIGKAIYGRHWGEDVDTRNDGFLELPTLEEFFGGDEPPEEILEVTKGLHYPLDFYPIEHSHSKKGADYLESRGIPLDIAKAYGIHYHPQVRRVIFPVRVGDKVLAWQARAIFPTTWVDEETGRTVKVPKILTTGRRDSALMFQDRLMGSEHMVYTEGPIDALKCHLVGGNVAGMGKIVTRAQLAIIRGSGVKRVYIGLDLNAGRETMAMAQTLGNSDFELYRLTPAPGYEDLGAMPMEGVLERFRAAEDLHPSDLLLSLPDRA